MIFTCSKSDMLKKNIFFDVLKKKITAEFLIIYTTAIP